MYPNVPYVRKNSSKRIYLFYSTRPLCTQNVSKFGGYIRDILVVLSNYPSWIVSNGTKFQLHATENLDKHGGPNVFNFS